MFSWGHGKLLDPGWLSHITKIRVLWIHDIFKFEESASSSYIVASFKFQSALDLKNRLRCLSHVTKIKVSRTPHFLVLAHVSQLSSFRMRWIWRIGSVLVLVNQTHIGIWCSVAKKLRSCWGVLKENCTFFERRQIIEISTKLLADIQFESSVPAEVSSEVLAEIRSELHAESPAESILSRRISKFAVQA